MFSFLWVVVEDVGTEVVTGEFGLVIFECAVVNMVYASLDRVDFDPVDISFELSVEALDVATTVVLDAVEIGDFGELTFAVKYVDLGVVSLDKDTVFWGDVVLCVAMVEFCEVADVNLVDLLLENDGLDRDVVSLDVETVDLFAEPLAVDNEIFDVVTFADGTVDSGVETPSSEVVDLNIVPFEVSDVYIIVFPLKVEVVDLAVEPTGVEVEDFGVFTLDVTCITVCAALLVDSDVDVIVVELLDISIIVSQRVPV